MRCESISAWRFCSSTPRSAAGDDLAALLAGRKAKEVETEAMRKRVEEEVEEDYTTGLVVNYDLAKAVGGRRRSI